MLKTLQDLFLVLTSVLFIVDPLTAVPTFLAMTARDTPQVRRLMARRGAWTCAVIARNVGTAVSGSTMNRTEGIEKEDVGIMPLGIPMLAGPGAISTVMVLSGAAKTPLTAAAVYAAIALTAFLSYVTLAAATRIEQRLGQTGMRSEER